jgi:4-amino-4-deoxy-L-arabinose transferase-like glycosyltransferase
VLGALATALLVADLACRWYGRRVGVLAGLMQVSGYYVILQARLGEADMVLCAAVTGAFYAMARWRTGGGRSATGWSCLFYACVGLALMTKYLVGPALILPGAILYALVARDGGMLRLLLNPLGMAIGVVIAAAWPLAAYMADPSIVEAWRHHNLRRFSEGLGRSEPWYFYLYTTPMMLLPWVFWLAGGTVAAWRQRLLSSRPWLLALAWLSAGVTVLSFSAFKHQHYVIPVLPPLTVLAAWSLERFAWMQRRSRLQPALLLALLAGGAVALGALVRWRWPGLFDVGLLVLAASGVLLAACIVAQYANRPRLAIGLLMAAILVGCLLVEGLAMPHFDSYRDQAVLAREANGLVPAERMIYLVGLGDSHVAYYLRFPLMRVDRPAEWPASHPRDAYVLCCVADVEALAAGGSTATLLAQCLSQKAHDADKGPMGLYRLQPLPSTTASGPAGH